MSFEHGTIASQANGGTEQLVRRLERHLDPNLLKRFQIVVSRRREPLTGEFRIAYCHDLAEDPQAKDLLGNGKWADFDKIVFVSNWQMQQYNQILGVPYRKSVVIENFIDPIQIYVPGRGYKFPTRTEAPTKIDIVYTPTPHRGLELLVPVFDRISQDDKDVHLHVYSSFKLYNWDQRDQQYQHVLDICRSHPQITYHGTVENDVLREQLPQYHIFAYPSIWRETSCLCLIEAMSAGLYCVHPNYGALPDTSAGFTHQYQWHEDPNSHANIFYDELKRAIVNVRKHPYFDGRVDQLIYANNRFATHKAVNKWSGLLQSLIDNKQQVLAERASTARQTFFSFKTS